MFWGGFSCASDLGLWSGLSLHARGLYARTCIKTFVLKQDNSLTKYNVRSIPLGGLTKGSLVYAESKNVCFVFQK